MNNLCDIFLISLSTWFVSVELFSFVFNFKKSQLIFVNQAFIETD